MELYQVRYFLALCKTLNFTRASGICNVTQPALTRAIQRLEEELGGPLIRRERNLTRLTQLGRAMLPHLEATFTSAEMAKCLADSLRRGDQLLLKVGLSPAIPADVVGASLAELVRRFPTLEVQVDSDEQARLIEAMLEGELEAAILADDGNLSERLHCWELYQETCCVVFPPGHRFEGLARVPLSALDGETALNGRLCGDIINRISPLCGSAGASMRVRHRGGYWDHVQHLAAAGLGVALLPQRLPVLPPLISRPLEARALARPVVLGVVSGRQYSPALDGFVKLNRARSFALAA
ncbi:MAG: LysR family transcriptional regulator [Acetobacteraceae bacterium]|nr:LysR family transcriptional regulator [Acetobacteraceae bacterium]